jgi:menaquinone-9 beta-reductase
MTTRSPLKPWDAIVIGARCAGAATALLLARGGARVLCIDYGDPGTDTLSTHALMRLSVVQLARWGVLDAIREAGTPQIRRTVFHYGDETVEVDIRPTPESDGLYAPRRTVLDLALVRAAAEAGVAFRFRTAFAGLIRDGSGRVTGAHVRHADGRTEAVPAGLVIGADGRRSAVARAVAAPVTTAGTHTSAVAYAYAEGLPNDGYRWFYAAGAGGGVIPTNDARSCLFLALPPGLLREALGDRSPSAFRRAIGTHLPPMADVVAPGTLNGPVFVHAGAAGFIRRAAGPGWALVGDAGYFKDPLTAHGITDAFRDAEVLATAALSGDVSSYTDARDSLIHGFFRLTDEIASFGWTLDRLKAAHVELNGEMKRGKAGLEAILAGQRRAA